ncbi:sugar ABC transporter substrate-binding protein [Nocardioides sp. Iso805N]|uniref:sugar ABC transporter substrate-binding protein n=1 Tax=Nocardioides sp. Iso805N TaxID=1283287 RepID=UPI00035C5DAF|nr:sugar ABC transporter substrate-binding protein [Nocardioides sp. Iso805N]
MHTFIHPRRLGTGAVVVVAAFALAACGSGGSSTGSAKSASTVDTAAAAANIKKLEQPIEDWPGITPIKNPVDLNGKNVMVVPLIAAVPILNGMATGAKEALEHMGAKVTICDGKASPTGVDSCLKQAQAQKYAAVITNFVAFPMDPNGFTALADSGTKILIAGDSQIAGTTYPKNIQFFDSSASLKQIGTDEADAAVADKGADANVIWLSQTDNTNTIAQGDAGEAHFKELCPSCGFDRIKYATADEDKLPSQVSAALVSHPKTNEIVLSVDSIAAQVLQGIQSAGFSGKVKLIANGSDVAGLQRVASGQESDDFGASASYDGFALANALEQALAGEAVTPAVSVTRDFTKNNIGSLKISADEYDTPNWFGSDSFKKEYWQAWGGK